MKVLHYTNGRGFAETACGKSLHGWQGSRTPLATTDTNKVACKRCRKTLGLPA